MNKLLLPFGLVFLLFATKLLAQPVASFTVSDNAGCAPLLLQFNSTSTGAIVSYSWTRNGVPFANLPSPGAIFSVPGNYDICLTVTDITGVSATHCEPNYISVFSLPVASFTTNVSQGCTPINVTFNNTTTLGSAPLVSCFWDFGDGFVEPNDCSPTHLYTSAGNFNVSLIVVDTNGCQSIQSINNAINAFPTPAPAFTQSVDIGCNAPLTVQFFDATTPAASNYSYQWSFGDGGTANGASPTHTYNANGTYNVSLAVSNPTTGCSNTTTVSAAVQVGVAGTASIQATPMAVCLGNAVDFVGLTGTGISSWSWNFGDGNTSTDESPSHTYATAGCFTPTLQVVLDGCTFTGATDTCIIVAPLPVANFTFTPVQGCSLPFAVSFTDLSTNATSWSWTFGDSGLSTSQNPVHTYTTFGPFTPSLTVANAAGCTSSFTGAAVQLEQVQARFSASSIMGCAPLSTTFSAALTQSVAPLTSYFWNFGNGTTSTSPNPSVVYADTGRYTVTLIVTNALGCTDTLTSINYIMVGQAPVVSFIANPTTSCAEDPIEFTYTGSPFTDMWMWEFGDGGTSVLPNPRYIYRDTGHFNVTLRAFHNGCESSLTLDSLVYILGPIARFDLVRTCSNPYQIGFADRSIAAQRWQWNFGDPSTLADTSTAASPNWTYPTRGTYVVTLTVFNDNTGCEYTRDTTITITDPIAAFTISNTAGCAPLAVSVLNSSQDAATYTWSAPGSTSITPSSGANPVIRYNNPGLYSNIRLIVRDVNGCRDTLVLNDTIISSAIQANFTASPIAGCAPLTVNFQDASVSIGSPITNWLWSFGDTTANPTQTYTTRGNRIITLTATNSLGCSDDTTRTAAVRVFDPFPRFTADTLTCVGTQVTFNNQSLGSNIMQYQWSFGDGNTSTAANPTHTYQAEGTYQVCLTAIDGPGGICDSTLCRFITVANPVANFVADTTYATCPPLVVTFTNQSIGGVSHQWFFGNGSSSTATNPVHVYTQGGYYDVTLIITGSTGCRDTIVYDSLIHIEGPSGSFSFAPDQGCVPLPVTLTGTSVGALSYTWVMGDGGVITNFTTSNSNTVNYTYNIPGTYSPSLLLDDGVGCQVLIESPNTITAGDIVAAVTALDSTVCDFGQVNFLSISSSTFPITGYNWTFTGGTPGTSTSSNPTITFNSPGSYDATLIVTALGGLCRDTVTVSGLVEVTRSPTAAFTATPLSGCAPLNVAFSDTSTSPDAPIVSWRWIYGDGTPNGTTPSPTHLYGVAGSYAPTLIVTTSSGCSDTISSSVTVFPVPNVSAGPDQTVCINEVFQLQATSSNPATDTYSWSPASLFTNPSAATQTLSLPSSGLTALNLTVTSADGCVSNDQVIINVIPFPVPVTNLQNDTLLCRGDFVQLFVEGGATLASYVWDNATPGLSCYQCADPIAIPTSNSTYVVTVTGPGGCQAIDSISIQVSSDYFALLGSDRTICQGDSVVLNLLAGNSPVWQGSSLSCTTCPTPVASPSTTSSYIATVINSDGCPVRDTLVVIVQRLDAISAGTMQTTCIGTPVTLNGSGPGGAIVSWTPAATLSNPSVYQPTANPDTTTTYILSVTTDLCTLQDEVTVVVETKADIAVRDTVICAGDTVQLRATGFASRLVWSPASGLINPSSNTPLATPSEHTTYQVIGQVGSCEPDTASMTVFVRTPATIIMPETKRVYAGTPVVLNATVLPVDSLWSYQWSPPSLLSCTTCLQPSVVADTIDRVVRLTVYDMYGCATHQDLTLKVLRECDPEALVLPNAFSPNGDGVNDVLFIRPAAIGNISMFTIYNRWGELVFQTMNINQGWDGSFRNKMCSTGVYVYVIEFPCPVDGSPVIKKGNVTLLR